jgi:hypothetical protein
VGEQAPAEDNTPDAFDFTDVTDASPGQIYEDHAAVTGVNRSLPASVSGGGGQIRKNDTGSWGTSLSVNPGDKLNVRLTSSPAHGTAVTTTVTVGGVSADWAVSTSRVIIIDNNVNDFNLRAAHDALYPAPTGSESPPINVIATIQPGVIVGSTSTATPAFDVGDWPEGMAITVYVRGRIQGRGGDGGNAGKNGANTATYRRGQDGGNALYTRHAINLILDEGDGEIWGGGGGGAGGAIKDSGKQAGSGGGGAGTLGGQPGAEGNGSNPIHIGEPGTATQGGDGGQATTGEAQSGAAGGAPGVDGESHGGGSFQFTSGGAAGPAIDGVSFVTKTGTGDIRGAEFEGF